MSYNKIAKHASDLVKKLESHEKELCSLKRLLADGNMKLAIALKNEDLQTPSVAVW
jgi:hypothetical protein